ncbi:MAG TPA: GDSL-type esterase/lipase family protein [Streptosporangiaceae bacterium]|jgi:lysophospholipase L1-like esterase
MSIRPATVITVIAATAAALAATFTVGSVASASRSPLPTHWSASWASAMQQPVASSQAIWPNWSTQGFSDQTVRQQVRISSGGSQIRVRLSNLYGTEPLRIAAATVAESGGGAATEPGTMRSLTFGGRRSVAIPAGQVTASDAAGLRVSPLEQLTVTLYLAGATGPATFHDDGLTTTYQATGDHVRDSGSTAFDGPASHSYYYLTGVDVPTRRPETVVAFGDSITNGHNSTVGGNARYTDALAERLIADHSPLSVANAGITGNLLLHQLPCFGETGLTRFQRDALDQPGVRTVILMEGSNDIWDYQDHGCGTTPAVTAAQIIDGLRVLIRAAHARGIRVVGATILPFKADFESPADFQRAEAIRQAVNNWTLSSGQYDAVADFAAAVADPADPQQLNPSYDSGDHLHPNDTGYQAIAAAINIDNL